MLTTATATTSTASTETTTMMTTREKSSTTQSNTLDSATATKTILKTTTTITSDPGILCFHHCTVKVFCFILPHICPQCKTALTTHSNSDGNSANDIVVGSSNSRAKINNIIKLKNNQSLAHDSNKDDNEIEENGICNNVDGQAIANHDADHNGADENYLERNSFTASRLLPFRLPYPFVRANQYPCAILLRPTTGDFLNDYNNTTDLHIAVTTSTCYVVEFDRHGLRRHRTDKMSEWWQCLLVGDVPEPWYDYWDQVLFEICQQTDKWTVAHYHEDKHNCYTFVLTFLQALTYDKLSEAATSKTRFCEKYIVPRTTTAGKYISLYRKLRDAGIYVHHTGHHKVRYVKQEKYQQQQQNEHQQLQLLQQGNPNNSNNLTTRTMTKNSLVTIKQQQQQQQNPSNHHNHHSIISRPHSTLCTIEE